MPTLRVAKLDARYLRSWKAAVREKAQDIRRRTLAVTRDGTPLTPVCHEQRAFMLTSLSRLYADLTTPCVEAATTETLWLVSGSYARGTCLVGSDLDIDAFYPNHLFVGGRVLEHAVISTVTEIFGFSRRQLHPQLKMKAHLAVSAATGKKEMFRHSYLAPFTSSFARPLGITPGLDRQIDRINWFLVRRLASRNFHFFKVVALAAARGEIVFPTSFDFAINLAFACGNANNYRGFIVERENAYRSLRANQDRLTDIGIALQSVFASRRDNIKKPMINTKHLRLNIKSGILSHLAFLVKLEKELQIDLLGVDRDKAMAAADLLYKLQSVLMIEVDYA